MLKEDLTWCVGRIKKLEKEVEELKNFMQSRTLDGEHTEWEIYNTGKTLKDIGWKGWREDEPLLIWREKE